MGSRRALRLTRTWYRPRAASYPATVPGVSLYATSCSRCTSTTLLPFGTTSCPCLSVATTGGSASRHTPDRIGLLGGKRLRVLVRERGAMVRGRGRHPCAHHHVQTAELVMDEKLGDEFLCALVRVRVGRVHLRDVH